MVGERTEAGIRNTADLVHVTKEIDRLEKRIQRLEAMLWKIAFGSAGTAAAVAGGIQLVNSTT